MVVILLSLLTTLRSANVNTVVYNIVDLETNITKTVLYFNKNTRKWRHWTRYTGWCNINRGHCKVMRDWCSQDGSLRVLVLKNFKEK